MVPTRSAVSGDGGPLVSVVIPHYDDLHRLGLCLDALGRQSLDPARFEVIVADNMSPCGVAALEAAIAGRARLVQVAERGAGPNRNGAAAVARGAILAFTDADCVPEPDWLAHGLAALDAYDLIGGCVTVFAQDPARMTPTEAFETVFAFDVEQYVRTKNFTVTANLFTRRDVYDAVGGFRNHVAEDVEWCHRAIALGFRLGYAPDARVAHPARHDWAQLLVKFRRTSREMYRYGQNRPAWRLRWLLHSWAMPVSALAHLPRVLRSPRLPHGRARLGAAAILFRLRFWRFVEGNRLLLGGR